MKDSYTQPIKGYFKVESFDYKNNLLETFEEENLIVDTARPNIAELIAGVSSGVPINKFVIGTEGVVNNNIAVAKSISSGLDSTRTKLFSEETVDGGTSYAITFAGSGNNTGTRVVSREEEFNSGVVDSSTTKITTAVVSSVSITANTDTKTVTYVVSIPPTVANYGDGTDGIYYSEAGFYAGSRLFNIKTFQGIKKDNTSTLVITWTLTF
jgi:hypothetical protein